MSTYFDIIKKKYESLFRLNIINNEHLIVPSFHFFLGVVCPVRWIKSGRYISTRLHPFIIQPSGTGKGEIMTMHNDLFRSLGYKTFYGLKATEAALTMKEETQYVKGSKPTTIAKPGLLGEKHVLFFDEGRELLSNEKYYSEVRDAFNMAMGENGKGGGLISKALKNANIEYPSHSSLCSGSVLTASMTDDVLDEGFFQRCFLMFKNFTEKDILEMQKKMLGLVQVDKFQINNIVNDIKVILGLWETESKKVYSSPSAKVPFIKYDSASIPIIKQQIQDYWEEKIQDTFTDDKQLRIMTFLTRNFVDKVAKVAVHKAVFELKPRVDHNDYKYALSVCDVNVESIKSLLSTLDVKAEVALSRDKRETRVLQYIRENKHGWSKQQFFRYLELERENGNWDVGSRTAEKLVKSLVQKGKVELVSMGTGNGKAGVHKVIRAV